MILKFKKLHPNAKIPTRAYSTDSGLDLVAVSKKVNDLYIEYDFGLAVEFEHGFDVQIRARSGCSNRGMQLCNGVGTVDYGFCGSLKARFYYMDLDLVYSVGERVAQLVVVPLIYPNVIEIDELIGTERGEGGFGSSGV